MRRAARVDENQKEIVQALRDAGCYVWIIGLPVDLLVGYQQHTFLMEIKTTFKKRLTGLQADFFQNWAGGTLCRVDGPQAALDMIRGVNAKH
jgi:phosphoserine phosphatase